MAISPAILGTGLIAPMQRDGKNDFAYSTGPNNVRAAVFLILTTRGASSFTQGELPWRTEFGSQLQHLKFLAMSGTNVDEHAYHFVVDALTRWEPRVIVQSVTTETDQKANKLIIHLEYTFIDKNVPDNAVFESTFQQSFSV